LKTGLADARAPHLPERWQSVARTGLLAALACTLASCDSPPDNRAPVITPEERQVGAEQHHALLAEFGGEYAGRQAIYVASLGEKLASAARLDGQCTFTLVNSDVVNAFAVPGCFIYVTRGMMALVNSEAELASVLGHELGHIAGAHSRRQQTRSLWRTLAVLAVSLTGSDRLTQIAGQAAQFFGLRYSRKQEYEADDYGIRVLEAAGYDPYAAGDMLAALGRNETFMLATGGHDEARAIPEWVRSHPLTDNRVQRAREKAAETGLKDDELPEGAQPLLNVLDGMIFGDDPAQGFVLGRRFAHPVMRIAFEAPPGFTLTNSPQAVGVSGPDIRGEFAGGPLPPGGLKRYATDLINQVVGETNGQVGAAQSAEIDGLNALIVPVLLSTSQGDFRLDIAAYDAGTGMAYHFLLMGPASRPATSANALFRSFRRLSAVEANTLRPRFIRITQVRPGENTASLAQRVVGDRAEALFRMLNGLDASASVNPGTTVKLIEQR
jgi:predicted Zn-dependent protease